MTLLPQAWFCLDFAGPPFRTLELDSSVYPEFICMFPCRPLCQGTYPRPMLPPLAVQFVTVNNYISISWLRNDFLKCCWNSFKSYFHSVFFSTFRDTYYIKWTQNNVIIFPRYFPIIHQLSLKPSKGHISLLISSMSYEGRRNTRSSQQSICSRNSLPGKCQRVYWLPMRLWSIPSGYGRFLTKKGNESLSLSTKTLELL